LNIVDDYRLQETFDTIVWCNSVKNVDFSMFLTIFQSKNVDKSTI